MIWLDSIIKAIKAIPVLAKYLKELPTIIKAVRILLQLWEEVSAGIKDDAACNGGVCFVPTAPGVPPQVVPAPTPKEAGRVANDAMKEALDQLGDGKVGMALELFKRIRQWREKRKG